MLVAHASKASRAKRGAAGIVTPFVSCASTDHGDEHNTTQRFTTTFLHTVRISQACSLLYSTHFIYIIILATLYAKILRFQRTQTLVNKRDGLPSLRSFRRCCKTRPQQHTTMCREHLNRTDHHNLRMRMQRTAQALLCGAKHDCTMNALRTGHSQQKRQGSRPHGDDADNRAGPVQRMPSA